jgi:hypothetical protein
MSERETKRSRVSLERLYDEEDQRVRRFQEEYLAHMRRLAEEAREQYVLQGLLEYIRSDEGGTN